MCSCDADPPEFFEMIASASGDTNWPIIKVSNYGTTDADYYDRDDIPEVVPVVQFDFSPEELTIQQNKAAILQQWQQSHRLPVGRRRSDVVPRRRIHRRSAKG